MRRVLAVLLAFGGAAALAVGVLLLTAFAPPSTLTTSTTLDGDGPVAVVTAPGVLALSGPEATVRVTAAGADDPVFVALVRPDDATAWLDGAAVETVTGVTGPLDAPRTTVTTGGEGPAGDPRTSDVWITAESGTGSAGLRWPTEGDAVRAAAGPATDTAVLLVTGDGTTPFSGTVTLQWPLQDAQGDALRHPAAVPLVVAGAALLVLAVLLLVLARRSGRRGRRSTRREARPADQEGAR
ncbi:hypothetical protein ACFFKU_05660 [Kineococcus gynurae]|uniref:Uncharacterized protein n=1 Tax=Kineococcus gynurae TaxID=452979 RepID=A0ABV5LMY2_9ACTN